MTKPFAARRFWTLAALLAAVGFAQPSAAQLPAAQLPANPGVPPTARTVNLTLEQRHAIRELAREAKLPAAADDRQLAVGDRLPPDAKLEEIPAIMAAKVPQIRSQRLYLTPSRIAIVDPQERRVVEVIE